MEESKLDENRIGRKQDWTKKVGRKQVGRKQVGRKLGARMQSQCKAEYERIGMKYKCEGNNARNVSANLLVTIIKLISRSFLNCRRDYFPNIRV